ncbi:DUF3313 family protein [Congregibacter litoralis]|uniref:Lipoprotein n=1 Tax=Congregibacter litoralis KT71 TaxID=314285 RepID=A4A7W3_9GAMM|nr:DUF3313 family protein [Congregibacter litoralis]EAQ97758.1 hypothetical protein KT71_14349 [Congregibacter litoralis KT71]
MHAIKKLTRAIAVAITPLALLSACAEQPSIQQGEGAETILGGLAKVDNSRADLAYVDPNADYARYTKVLIEPLDLDNVEIVQPDATRSMVNRYNREWELTDEDKAKLQTAFNDAMEKALQAGGAFEIASDGGDDVIRLEAMVTRIAPVAPKDDMQSRTTARSTVITQGGGSISVAIMLADGDSGEPLAIIKDSRSSMNSNMWSVNNSVTNMAEVRRNFSSWAKQIHDGLLAMQARGNAAAE